MKDLAAPPGTRSPGTGTGTGTGTTDIGRTDIATNRATRKWSRREKTGRALWALASPFFRFSPRPCWGWRRGMLRLFGAKVGADVHIHPSARITIPWNLSIGAAAAVGDGAILYALGPIRIGARATISQWAHLCAGTHDITRADRPLVRSPITIGDDAWIAADAFVGPGVTIGARAIVGARAVAMKHVTTGAIVAGNPARPIRTAARGPTAGAGAGPETTKGTGT